VELRSSSEGGWNLHGYSVNNPISFRDPDGLAFWDVARVGLDLASFVRNVNNWNYWWAAVDASLALIRS